MANNEGRCLAKTQPVWAMLWLAACAMPDSTEGAADAAPPALAAEVSPTAAESAIDVRTMIAVEAARQGVPPALALAVAKVGSNVASSALDATGAVGTMQIPPALVEEFDMDADDLREAPPNIHAGIRCLAVLGERYAGDWQLALSHYRGGPLTKTDHAFAPHSFTRRYVRDVLRQWRLYRHDPLTGAWLRKMQGLPRFVASGPGGATRWPVAVAASPVRERAEVGGRWRAVGNGGRFR